MSKISAVNLVQKWEVSDGREGWGGGGEGGNGEVEKKAQEEGGLHRWILWNAWVDIGFWVELQADTMPGATEAMAFTDSYKHMECLDGMRLHRFLTFFTCTPASHDNTASTRYKHPELSGCITTLTVRNTGCKRLWSNGHLD